MKTEMGGEHVGTMVVPEVSPERTCMLGRFPVVLWVGPPLKGICKNRGSSLPTSLTKLRETCVVGTIAA